MAYDTFLTTLPAWVLLIVGAWELIWKGIALWKCGRNKQLVWFIFILILNTVGILPIIYLLFFQKRKRPILRIARKRSTKRVVRKPKKKVVKKIKKRKVKKKAKKKTTRRKKR